MRECPLVNLGDTETYLLRINNDILEYTLDWMCPFLDTVPTRAPEGTLFLRNLTKE